MKIVLALFGFFVAACCLPAPQILQSCDSGSNCGQNDAVLAGSRLKIKQDCRSGNCEQKNLENNGDFAGFDDFFKDDNDFGDINIQNCKSASECRQQNQGRKKRATVQAETVEKTQTYSCPGNGINGIRSQCRGNICEIICSDNTRYQHDCGSEGSQVSTSGNVVTVTCGGEDLSDDCFPFCPDTGSSSGSSSGSSFGSSSGSSFGSSFGNNFGTNSGTNSGSGTDSGTNSGSGFIQPPAQENFPSGGPAQQPPANDNDNVVGDVTALKSCIDSCPVNNSYRGCVNDCLRSNGSGPFPACFPFCNRTDQNNNDGSEGSDPFPECF